MAGPLSSVGAAADENAAPAPAVKLAAGFEAFTYRGPDQPPAAKRPRSSEAAGGDDEPSPAPARPAAARRALVSDDEDDAAPGPAAAAAAIVLSDDDDDDDDGAAAEAEPDPLDACEAIASSLRAALGAPVAGDRFAGTAAASATGALASADDVAAAAGHAPSARLKPYQVVGVNFLLLHAAKSGAAVVADDMGLGKTAQCCAALALRAARGTPGAPSNTGLPALVVVPSSLVDNWARELATWAPRLRVCRFWGAHRAALKATRPRPGDAPPFDVLLASYPTFERAGGDAKSDRSTIRKWDYGTVVLDEAHAIKNGASARAAKLRAAAAGARFRVFLTGTPLQNNLAELESLLSFLLPDVFARGGGLLTADDDGGDDEAAAVARARRALAPFILRRLKSEVADQLPEKKRVDVRLDLQPAQRDAYIAAVARLRADAAAAGATATPDGLVAALGAAAAASSFTLLRKLAAHPLLVRTRVSDASLADLAAAATAAGLYGDAATRAMVDAEVATLSDLAIHKLALDGGRRFEGWRLPADAARGSAKAAWLADNLPRMIDAGHRVLLFSGWTSVLDILELLLADLGLPFSRLDGNTPVADRLALVDAFNAGGPDAPPVMLLSTRAGGQGLNLVGADTVVLHDSDFNPQVDAQAEDRAHRLGQTRPVTIYRLVADGTVDAGIVALAARKAALGAAVLGEGGQGGGDGGGGGGGTETEKTAVARLLADALSA